MATCSSRMPGAAGLLQVCLCYVVLILAITLSGAHAKSLLYNKTGRHIDVLTGHTGSMAVPPGRSVELEGAPQQRGVTIRDAGSGEVAGPFDLPDHHAFEAVWVMKPRSSATDTRNAGELANIVVTVNSLGLANLGARISTGP